MWNHAQYSKKQFKRPISLFSLCAVESSLLKSPIWVDQILLLKVLNLSGSAATIASVHLNRVDNFRDHFFRTKYDIHLFRNQDQLLYPLFQDQLLYPLFQDQLFPCESEGLCSCPATGSWVLDDRWCIASSSCCFWIILRQKISISDQNQIGA